MQKSKRFTSIGIALILAMGLIHISMLEEEFAEARYLGVLFVCAFIGSISAAIGIYKHRLLLGWGLGALIALGSIAGYVLGRTVGLPLSGVEPWGPAIGYLSLGVEIIFVALSARAPESVKLFGKMISESVSSSA